MANTLSVAPGAEADLKEAFQCMKREAQASGTSSTVVSKHVRT